VGGAFRFPLGYSFTCSKNTGILQAYKKTIESFFLTSLMQKHYKLRNPSLLYSSGACRACRETVLPGGSMRSKLLKLIAVLAVSSVTFLPLSFAQKTSGDISGAVTDQSGAAIPGSVLTLTDQATGAVRKTTSDSHGNFSFLQVPVGTYTITGTKEGFKTLTQKDVAVHVASVTTTAVRLEVGAITEMVTVEAAALNLNTENGEVGNTILADQVSQLPLNGRNFIELTTLMPGTAVGGGFDNKNKGLLAGVDISFSGAPANANQWQVNGSNNNDQGSQRTILIYPSVDAIQEFKILRNSYGP